VQEKGDAMVVLLGNWKGSLEAHTTLVYKHLESDLFVFQIKLREV